MKNWFKKKYEEFKYRDELAGRSTGTGFNRRQLLAGVLAAPAAAVVAKEVAKADPLTKEAANTIDKLVMPPPPLPSYVSYGFVTHSCVVSSTGGPDWVYWMHHPNTTTAGTTTIPYTNITWEQRHAASGNDVPE